MTAEEYLKKVEERILTDPKLVEAIHLLLE